MIGAEITAAPKGGRGARRSEPVDLLAYAQEEDTSWLLPYVDVVSLLLAFLILALAMSKVNLRKFEMVSAAISHQAPPPSLDVLKEKIDSVIQQQNLQSQVKTVLDDDGLRMELKSALLFDSGQAEITAAGHQAIDRVGKLLPTIDSRYQIAIEGHTDDVPIHTGRFDSNWELSSARAINVLKLFTAIGVSPQRLSAQGYADTRPASPVQGDAAAQARARGENRRVVIRVH
ncbi:MAG TPA: flagellar motor protein MotB [Polyangia bacterium]|nr:flagellar motor protein MotB [Polyangia bacterium]